MTEVILYNSGGITGNARSRNLFGQEISAKNLSPGRYNLFGQLSYHFTPLLPGSLPGIVNPSEGSAYPGPAFTWPVITNFEVMFTGQLFFRDPGTEFGELGKAVYGRLRRSF